ncbi:unnamed protein product, partial [Choristocarpus tenellus]
DDLDEDAIVASGVLSFLHARTRAVGDIIRITGDTIAGVTGGSIKAVGATVQGLSSVLDTASSNLDAHPGPTEGRVEPPKRYPSRNPAAEGAAGRQGPPHHQRPGDAPPNGRAEQKHTPDPLQGLSRLGRSTLAGSLGLVSTAVRGVGDAVFQAGTVAESITAGTGQVA